MAEELIMQDPSVLVTTARVNITGTMYALQNITSVRMGAVAPPTGCAFPIFLLGLCAAITGLLATLAVFWLGVVCMLIGVGVIVANSAWKRSLKPNYCVVIASTAGESAALWSRDGAYISRIVGAINQAVISAR